MEYSEIILRGLMYISSCLFYGAIMAVSVMLVKTLRETMGTNFEGNPIKIGNGKGINNENADMKSLSNTKESDEARKMRIELENIEAFYTDAMQKEVE